MGSRPSHEIEVSAQPVQDGTQTLNSTASVLLMLNAIIKGGCSCSANYIGETMRNVEVQIDEHSNPCNDSEPARRLCENLPPHSFSWRILCTAQSFHKCSIIEGLMIQQ